MLKHVDSSCIKAICDRVLNILKNIVKTSPVHKRKLARHKTYLCVLAEKKTPMPKRRRTHSERRRLSSFGPRFKRTYILSSKYDETFTKDDSNP